MTSRLTSEMTATMKEALGCLESWLDGDPCVISIGFTFTTAGGMTVRIDATRKTSKPDEGKPE